MSDPIELEFRTTGITYGYFDPDEFRGMTIDEVCSAILEAMGFTDCGDLDPDDVMAGAERLLEAANAPE